MEIRNWLTNQQNQERTCYLLIDTLAMPNPLKQIFEMPLTNVNDFVCIYKQTEFALLEEISPWLIPINEALYHAIQPLLTTPENNWGYLLSMSNQYTQHDLTKHWQDRMVIEEIPRSLYRFQDNRIIVRHLSQLDTEHVPLLLGPIDCVIAWDDERKKWQTFINNDPKLRPNPEYRPWLLVPEPQPIDDQIRLKNTMKWLLNNYRDRVYDSGIYSLYEWVEASLIQTDVWQWTSKEQQHFYILARLEQTKRDDLRWFPFVGEPPDEHFRRCKAIFNECQNQTLTY